MRLGSLQHPVGDRPSLLAGIETLSEPVSASTTNGSKNSPSHADYLQTAFRKPGADLSPEGVHCQGAEQLVRARRDCRRVARPFGRASRPRVKSCYSNWQC